MIVLLCFVNPGYAANPGFNPAVLVGNWVVKEVFCHGCGERRSDEIGTEIQIGAAVVVNPLGGNCEDNPGFSAFRPKTWQSVADQAGILPARARSLANARQPVMVGSITCSGLAYLPVVAINDALVLYSFDGGLTFLLVRK